MIPAKHLRDADGNCSPSCFPCKVKSVSIAPSAMETRYPNAARTARTDPQLLKDLTSYKALRKNGLQPRHIGGSHDLETRSAEPFEVETGYVESDPSLRKRYAEAFRDMPDTAPLSRYA